MKYIFLLLISVFLSKNNENRLFDFISKINKELDAYIEVKSVKQIPKGAFKTINKWKKQNFIAKNNLNSRMERKMFKFELADKGEPYNYGCIIEKKMLQRQLVYAAQNDSKWLIIYNHSNGGAGIQTKMLHINIDEPEKLSLIRIHEHVENKFELMHYLQNMDSQNMDTLERNLILIFGESFSGKQNSMYKGMAV